MQPKPEEAHERLMGGEHGSGWTLVAMAFDVYWIHAMTDQDLRLCSFQNRLGHLCDPEFSHPMVSAFKRIAPGLFHI